MPPVPEMNLLDFIASLVNALAWPIAVVLFAVLFRQPISKILLSLRSLRYKNLELDLKRDLSELEAKATKLKPIPATRLIGSESRACLS